MSESTGETGEFIAIAPDPYYVLLKNFSDYVDYAKRMANHYASSYRGVHVGSVLLGHIEGAVEPVVITGANVKPDERASKYCAEMDAIDQALDSGVDHTYAIFVAGPAEASVIRSISSVLTPTLHPCNECKEKLFETEIINVGTIIVTTPTEPGRPYYEAFSVGELQADAMTTQSGRDSRFTANRFSLSEENIENRALNYELLLDDNPDEDLAKAALKALRKNYF